MAVYRHWVPGVGPPPLGPPVGRIIFIPSRCRLPLIREAYRLDDNSFIQRDGKKYIIYGVITPKFRNVEMTKSRFAETRVALLGVMLGT